MPESLLDVRGLTKHFPVTAGVFKRAVGMIKAVDGVSFSIAPGETLGLVGESGCGKTTIGRLVLRLIEPTAGELRMRVGDESIDLARLNGATLRKFRRHMQLVFQDPYSSLSPRMTVMDIIAEPLRAAQFGSRREIQERVKWVTKAVGLQVEFLGRYPHAFSGGQRQRICIARALAINPKLVICDEPVSALDVSVQAQILNLLKDLQERLGMAYLFIAHDLSVVENISARVAVMYAGRIVESAPTAELFKTPAHPYTEALMNALPQPDPRLKAERVVLPGEVADPSCLPQGCAFHPRCCYAQDRCRAETPILKETCPGRSVACHRAEELSLRGVSASG
ncbi:MAG: ATP-binding cassette domain-containing protein [Candidatus Hydrogenedentes bacterium]|nr:ATP-binding cassette domain-containing protein [Candidatus Hydrogenedentota bacterium]